MLRGRAAITETYGVLCIEKFPSKFTSMAREIVFGIQRALDH